MSTEQIRRYRMEIDPRWHLLRQRGDMAVFRMVDGDHLLATCKIDGLPKLAPKKQVLLQEFQRDVRRALGANCQQIVEAEESTSPHREPSSAPGFRSEK